LAIPIAGIGLTKYKEILAQAAEEIKEKVQDILPEQQVQSPAN